MRENITIETSGGTVAAKKKGRVSKREVEKRREETSSNSVKKGKLSLKCVDEQKEGKFRKGK